MIKVFKCVCDKCGAEVIRNLNSYIYPRYEITKCEEYGKTESVDLCTKCMVELADWLKPTTAICPK